MNAEGRYPESLLRDLNVFWVLYVEGGESHRVGLGKEVALLSA